MTGNDRQSAAHPRLLVVDDELELRTLLAMKFSKSGFSVDVAATGAEAAEFLSREKYSAILCDLNLPENMNGCDVYNIAKTRCGDCTFIAITGYAPDSPQVRNARAAGIPHVFSKPLQMKAILELVHQGKSV